MVSLNRLRILSRVRSRHAVSFRPKRQAPLLGRLATAQRLLQTSLIDGIPQTLAKGLKALQDQLEELERMGKAEARSVDCETNLRLLIQRAHSLVVQHEQNLRLIPDDSVRWNRTATESLIDKLKKLSKYFSVCQELLKFPRRYARTFARVSINFINLQKAGRGLSGATAPEDIFDSDSLSQILSQVSRRRHKVIKVTKEAVMTRLTKTARVHAEIQLLLYFERDTGSGLQRPRVICSSKSACYLCHLFFKIHGQFYIPNTHGKLYESWKWPQARSSAEPQLQHLLTRFSQAIDEKIRDCLLEATKARRMDPFESMVDLLDVMTPSALSRISQQSRTVRINSVRHQEIEDEPARQQSPDRLITSQDASAAGSGSKRELSMSNMTKSFPGKFSVSSLTDGVKNQALTNDPETNDSEERPLYLHEGDVSSHSFSMENDLLQVQIPGLHVTFQYDAFPPQDMHLGDQASQSPKTPLQIEIQCPPSSDHGSSDNSAETVDLDYGNWVEKICPEGILFSANGLLLKRKSVSLRLRVKAA